MIIIGYPGIGKTTYASRHVEAIDLESSRFNGEDGKKPNGWEQAYCRVAEDLSIQGYIVFVSSHKVVQDYFAKKSERVAIIYPDRSLKDEWIQRLYERYERSDDPVKDKAAYENVRDNFDSQIEAIEQIDDGYSFTPCPITDINYDIELFMKPIIMILHYGYGNGWDT